MLFPADGSAERPSDRVKRDINEKRERWKLHPGEKENTSRSNARIFLLFLPSSVARQDAAHSQLLKQLNYSIYTVPLRKPNPIKSCSLI